MTDSETTQVQKDPGRDRPEYMTGQQKYVVTWVVTIACVIALAMILASYYAVTASNNDAKVDRVRAKSKACTELMNDVDQRDCMERVD